MRIVNELSFAPKGSDAVLLVVSVFFAIAQQVVNKTVLAACYEGSVLLQKVRIVPQVWGAITKACVC